MGFAGIENPAPPPTQEEQATFARLIRETHMETTMRNLEKGLGAWDEATQTSLTATYDYS